MPPKKKKGNTNSGKKKNGQKSAAKLSTTKLNNVFNEMSKEFYLVQIRDLETKIDRYQVKCDRLELRNKEIETNFELQAADKKEIVSFLKKQLENRSDEIADFQEQLIGLQQSKDQIKDKYELELSTIKTEMLEIQDRLTSENMLLGGKLASLEEFRLQKEDLMQKFADMEEMLKSQEKEHKEEIYHLERKSVLDKDRLKKEMISRVNTVAAEFRKVSNKQMAETTKRTIQENVVITSQLSKMSEKTMELIDENDKVRQKEKEHKQLLEIMEETEKVLVRKNTTSQNVSVIRMLTEKASEQQQQLDGYIEKEAHYNSVDAKMKQLQADFDDLKCSHDVMQEKLTTQTQECNQHQKSIQMLSEDKEYLIGLLSDTTNVISQALQHNNEEQDECIQEMKNTSLLRKVIDILNLAVEMGVGVNPKELACNRKGRKSMKEKYVDLNSLRPKSFKQTHATKPLAHYRSGDLGLVPSENKTSGLDASPQARKEKTRKPRFMNTMNDNSQDGRRPFVYHLSKSTVPTLPVLASSN